MQGLLFFTLVALTSILPLTGQASEADFHCHHLSVILGGTEKGHKTATTYGVEYAYRVSERWDIGGWYEDSTGDFELDSIGVLGNFHVTENFPLLLGLGSERELFGDDKFLIRAGASYRFHAGPVTIAPADLFYGATFGIGF